MQVFSRLFPFKRGLTHAYWAPNFWALYNTADKIAATALRIPRQESSISSSSGLVQEVSHQFLPSIKPRITFVLTVVFMIPILIKLGLYTQKRYMIFIQNVHYLIQIFCSDGKITFLRSVVLCSAAAFTFGWHVHEKAILMCLIPLTLLSVLQFQDAKYSFILSICGYFSLFPLLFHTDLFLIRYSLFLAYISFMYGQFRRLYREPHFQLHLLEWLYVLGFLGLPLYEHFVAPFMGLNQKLPFMPLLLTSVYCSLGVLYVFLRYYILTLSSNSINSIKNDSKLELTKKSKSKLKQKTK